MSCQNINIGLIGAGRAASFHLQALQNISNCRITGIYDIESCKSKKLSNSFNIEKIFYDPSELIKSDLIDAIIIAVEPKYQPAFVIDAFKKNKHVLCEKPLGLCDKEIKEIEKVYEVSKSIGMINFCYRLIPEIELLKQYLKDEKCGKVHNINVEWILSNRLNMSLSNSWKAQKEEGGGVLQNFGIHVLDYLFWDVPEIDILAVSLNTYIKERVCHSGKKFKVSGDENASLVLSVPNGPIVNIQLSLVSDPGLGHRINVRGAKGTIEVSNSDINYHGGGFDFNFRSEKNIDLNKTLYSKQKISMSDMFYRVDKRFIDAIFNNDKYGEPSIKSGIKVSNFINEIFKKNK